MSLTATSRLAERHCREQGQAIPAQELLAWLATQGIDAERAHAGITFAVTVGRLETFQDPNGRPYLRTTERTTR